MTLLRELGVTVGHWSDHEAETGCTVVLLPPGCVGSAEIRGGAPASRELDVLRPDKSVQSIDAVVLTGGSAFGLGTADGVMGLLEQRGRGVPTPAGPVPIVPTLAIFDLAAGSAAVRPGPGQGLAAARAATGDVETGRVGAGTGAYVNQQAGPKGRRPGGLVYAEVSEAGVRVGALVVVNAFGDIGSRSSIPLQEGFGFDRTHTTIGVVVTDARLTKADCFLVAQGAHDGLARALSPPHTRFDGDAFIAVSAGTVTASVDHVRWAALQSVTAAVAGLAAAAPAGSAPADR